MTSVYPGALDTLATNKSNTVGSSTDHPAHHNDLADAVNKIEAELGINPSGSFATVVARLDAASGGSLNYGTLASRPTAATAGDKAVYVVTDENGGTIYQVQGGAWAKIAPGAAEITRGVLGRTKVTGGMASTALTASAGNAITGFSVTFTYNGRPIQAQVRMPWSKYTIANDLQHCQIYDNVNAKEVYRETLISPATASTFYTPVAISDYLTTFTDGTNLVSGTSYTWIGRLIPTTAGNFTTTYAANSAFYGHIEIVEG